MTSPPDGQGVLWSLAIHGLKFGQNLVLDCFGIKHLYPSGLDIFDAAAQLESPVGINVRLYGFRGFTGRIHGLSLALTNGVDHELVGARTAPQCNVNT